MHVAISVCVEMCMHVCMHTWVQAILPNGFLDLPCKSHFARSPLHLEKHMYYDYICEQYAWVDGCMHGCMDTCVLVCMVGGGLEGVTGKMAPQTW